jgi:long-chain fatty acid transport protein
LWLATSTIAVILLRPQPASATDGIEPIGVSMQSRARGGADVAVGDSALSQIDNPATLSLSPRDAIQFDASGQVTRSLASWQGPVDTVDSQKKWLALANSGLALPMDDRLTFGLALHSKAGLGTRYNARHLMIPFMERRVGSDMKCLGLHFNLAYQLTDKLSVGAGGRAEMASAEFSTVLGPADLEFGRGYAYGGGFQLGLHYQAREDLAFGLAYRSPTWFNDLSGGQGRAALFGLVPVPLGDISIDELRLAQKLTGGVAWDAVEWLKLIGEVRWLNYGNSTFDGMTIATDGLIDLRYPFPLGYQDQWVFIAGAEFKLDEHWTLGMGYHYATQPVSPSNLLPMGSTIPQHHATMGLRYEKDNWWIGGGYIVAFPATLRGPGRSDIPLGIDYGSSEIEQSQHSLVFGFGWSW